MNAPLLQTATATAVREATRIDNDFERLLQRSFTPRDILEDNNFDKLWRMAEALANSALSVPKELKGNIGDCLAIVTQAMIWGLNPFSVAQKAHVINGKLGYEAQLVNAVVMQSGAIKGSFRYEYRDNDECRVGAILRGESAITWGEWLKAFTVTTKNSPLWKTNPKQQMGYLQVKNWARAYCPGALLGIYTADELEGMQDAMTPAATVESISKLPVLPPYSQEAFEKNFPDWAKRVKDGKKTGVGLLTMFSTKNTFTPEQQAALKALDTPEPPAAEKTATDTWVDDMNAAEGAAQ